MQRFGTFKSSHYRRLWWGAHEQGGEREPKLHSPYNFDFILLCMFEKTIYQIKKKSQKKKNPWVSIHICIYICFVVIWYFFYYYCIWCYSLACYNLLFLEQCGWNCVLQQINAHHVKWLKQLIEYFCCLLIDWNIGQVGFQGIPRGNNICDLTLFELSTRKFRICFFLCVSLYKSFSGIIWQSVF